MTIDTTSMMPYLIALGFTALIVLLIVLIYLAVKRSKNAASHDEQLKELLIDDYGPEQSSAKVTMVTKWNNHWGNILKSAGVLRYSSDHSAAGRDVFLFAVGAAVIMSVITRNVIVGAAVAAAGTFGVSMYLKMKAGRKSEDIAMQLPGFLFSLKANIQAADTNERAMLKVVDSMPSPLFDDLQIVKNRLLANGSFREALEEMSEKTSSRDLKFLCACMIQASLSGANMVNQIDSIQKVLEARRKVNDEINKAVKTVQPAIWLSTVVIPVLFLASYFMDANARMFWFIDPMSWIAMGATVVFYIAGMLLTKKQVDAIRDM